MKKSNEKRRVRLFTLWAALIVIAASLFTGCPDRPKLKPVPKYKVTFSVDGANGTLTAQADGKAITSGAEVEKDKTVVFTATPNPGFKVKAWTLDGAGANGTNGTYPLKITKAVNVKVSFESTTPDPVPKYKVTFSVDGANGTLTAKADGKPITSGAEVEKDKTVVFTATPDTGFKVKAWTLDGKAVNGNNGTYPLKIAKAVNVRVSFESTTPVPPPPPPVKKHKVTLQAGANGTLTGNPAIPSDGMVAENTEIVFTAVPAQNFVVGRWTVSPSLALIQGGAEGNTTAKVKVKSDISVTVHFNSVPEGNVLYKVEHWKQNIENDEYTKAEEETLYGVPNEQTAAQAKTYTGFTAKLPIAQQTIADDGSTVVRIEYDRNEITLTLNLDGGTTSTPLVDGDKLKGRFEAQVPTVENPTREGYTFKGWSSALPEKFPAQDTAYTAQWQELPKYKIRFAVGGGSGTITAKAGETAINTGDMVTEGKELTFTAVPASGCMVESWTGITPPSPNVTEVKHTVTGELTVWVAFKQIAAEEIVTVQMYTDHNGTISVNPALLPGNKAVKGSTLVFTATPKETHFVVDRWGVTPPESLIEGGTEGSTTAKVKISADHTQVIVSFKVNPQGTAAYKVEHHKQNVAADGYTLDKTEDKTGFIGELTQAQAETHEGFSAQPITQEKILADGSTVVKVYYDRNMISLTLDLDGGTMSPAFPENKITGRFGAPLPAVPEPTKPPAHYFVNWNPYLPAAFPSQDRTYTAEWERHHYAVTYGAQGGGTIKANDGNFETQGGIWAKHGDTVRFTAKPNKFHRITKWTVNGATINKTTDTHEITVTEKTTVSVYFKKIQYTEVAYADLETYLAGAQEGEVNYIEITGTIPAADFKGTVGPYEAGALGKKIKRYPSKKVDLILPLSVPGLIDMDYCFYDCTNLVAVRRIPQGVKNMDSCFSGCTSLAAAPEFLPSSVKNMKYCFSSTALTEGPDIPSGVINMQSCFSRCEKLKRVRLNCNYSSSNQNFYHLFFLCYDLEDGGIEVPAAYYDKYISEAALDDMLLFPHHTLAERRAKFKKF